MKHSTGLQDFRQGQQINGIWIDGMKFLN